jgi:hypothetical protein
MVFSVPAADGQGWMEPDEAEAAWQACRKGVETQTGLEATARRVYSLSYVHNGRHSTATVGEPDYYPNEIVMAIIALPQCSLICSVIHGYLKIGGTPMVGNQDVRGVEDFQPE